MENRITFEELTDLNYLIKWLQGMRAKYSPVIGKKKIIECSDFCGKISGYIERFGLVFHECYNCKLNLTETGYSNIVIVPTFPGLVSRCANCRQQYTYFGDRVITIDFKPVQLTCFGRDEFAYPPGFLKNVLGVWRPEKCGFDNVVLNAETKWHIDFLSFKEMQEWLVAPSSSEYWHDNLRDKFERVGS